MSGKGIIAGAIEEAAPFHEAKKGRWPSRGKPYLDMEAGQWRFKADKYGMPPDCPVVPLGTADGSYFFLDGIGQLRKLGEGSFGLSHVESLFGRHLAYVYWAWPYRAKVSAKDAEVGILGSVTNFRAEEARRTLFHACHSKGVWSSMDKLRGRGCWLERNGSLLVHCGDMMFVGMRGEAVPPGEREGLVYSRGAALAHPWAVVEQEEDVNPVVALLDLFRTFNFRRPEVDPVLLLGFVAQGFLCGALDWRSLIFLIGDRGIGKSTLQKILKGVLGNWLIDSVDATAAGIYQSVRQDALAVAVDELEAEADTRKVKGVMKLARIAASGGKMQRGGGDNVATEFRVKSAFLFSAINHPPMEPQDYSRFVMMHMDEIPKGADVPEIDMEKLSLIGRLMLKRLLTDFPRFNATLRAYHEQLRAGGHDGRGCDTFGTLLACADLALGDDWERAKVPMGDDLTPWATLLAARDLAELDSIEDNWRLCLDHLLNAPIDIWRNGALQTVGQQLEKYWSSDDQDDFDERKRVDKLRDEMAKIGIGVTVPRGKAGYSTDLLEIAIPVQSPQIHKIFLGSKWAGEMGAGVWTSALQQAPARLWRASAARISGIPKKSTLIRLDAIYGADSVMEGD